MIILARPIYASALNLEDWVKKNRDALMGYWIDCDEAVIQSGGPAASVDDFEDFCRTQWDQFILDQFNDDDSDLASPEELDEYEVRLSESDKEDGV